MVRSRELHHILAKWELHGQHSMRKDASGV